MPSNKKVFSPLLKKQLLFMTPILIIVFGISLFLWQSWVLTSEQTKLNSRVNDYLDRQQQVVTGYVKSIEQKMEALARLPELKRAIIEDDSAQLTQYSQDLVKQIPEAVSVRFFQLDQAQKVSQAESQMTHLEIHMINRAEKNDRIWPEIVSQESLHKLMLARPVYGSEKTSSSTEDVIGTMLVITNLSELQDTLTQNTRTPGKLDLSQRIDQSNTTFLSFGEGGDMPLVKQSISNTYWTLQFIPAQSVIDSTQTFRLYFILGAIIFALLSMLITFIVTKAVINNQFNKKQVNKDLLEAGEKQLAEVNPNILAQPVEVAEIEADDSLLLVNEELGEESPDSALVIEDADVDEPASSPCSIKLSSTIFRSYDIRGVVGEELTPDIAELIGKAIASMVIDAGDTSIVVARDGRQHSAELCERMTQGILSTGCDVIDIGLVPTPLMNFAALTSEDTQSGVMVTASHNPKEYNGFKFLVNGTTLSDEQITQLKTAIDSSDFRSGEGLRSSRDIAENYIDRVLSDVALAGYLHVVVDASNGAASILAPKLFEELGCDVTPLFCEVDGNFPNHPPNPSDPENLHALINKVIEVEADLGVALDGDGDRLVVVAPNGSIIWPDQLLMLFAKDVVSRNPGCDIIYDVKSTRELSRIISDHGGRPVMYKTGHSHMKSKMQEIGALLAGEYSGHIFFKERWYGFDDGMYAAARLMEILTVSEQSVLETLNSVSTLPSTPEILVPIEEDKKFYFMEKVINGCDFGEGKKNTIDGLRVDYSDGWGLVRASNTSAALTLRFEAVDDASLESIQKRFKTELLKVNAELILPF